MESTFDYKFYPQLMLRMPSFPYEEYNTSIQHHLKDPYFKSAIFWASKSLFTAIEKSNFNFEALSEKQKSSLRMYLNRMCFRPTPFGLFSGFSFVRWGKCENDELFFRQPKIHFNIDYGYSILIARRLILESLRLTQLYITNPSLYKIGNEYRYIRCHYNMDGHNNEFTIDNILIDEAISGVLFFCRNKKTGNEILSFIQNTFDLSPNDAEEYFNEILEKQAILPNLLPNITGEDYLKRILNRINSTDLTTKFFSSINEVYSKTIPNTDNILRESVAIDIQIMNYSESSIERNASGYVNLELPTNSGAISTSFQKKIQEGLYCVDCLLPKSENNYLSKFSSEFNIKFGKRWIPLMVALDPEIGIDMGSLSIKPGALSIMSCVELNNPLTKNAQIEWTPAHSLLLDKWNKLIASNDKNLIIHIEESDLRKLISSQSDSYPSGISVIFRTVNENVYIEQAGGVSPVALSARFSQFNSQLKQSLSDLIKIEEESNPDVIFAEIVHNCDFHVSNVERRPAFREFEIPIFNSSTLPEEKQILLNELWVSVQNDEILLWSKRLNKRIIPRLTSALNFEGSELPIFRFLCELQHQQLRSNLHFELSLFFPDLLFYPRVHYKNAIISLSSWHFAKDYVDDFFAQYGKYTLKDAVRKLAIDLNWPRYISINKYDNYLVFDTCNDEDLVFLGQMLKKENRIIIKEFPFINQSSNIIKNRDCNHVKQYFAYLYHNEKIYNAISPELNELVLTAAERKFPPGSSWSYFKIYCHPASANNLILEHIIPLCNRWLSSGFLNQWFFIRYRDPEFHLRIRFNMDPIHSGLVIRTMSKCLAPLIHIGLITDFQLATYERELERYDIEIIDELESCFCASAALIAKLLEIVGSNIDPLSLFEIAYSSLDALFDEFSYDLIGKIDFTGALYKSMELEFDISEQTKAQLRKRFRELRNKGGSIIQTDITQRYQIEHEFNIFQYLHRQVSKACINWSPPKRDRLLANLIHMHLNRLFPDSPRKNELIIYYCLWRHYQSQLGRLQSDLLKSFANN